MPKKTVSMESLKNFIRSKSAHYLNLPGVTSIGVGHKVRDGKVTGELCIQFTVAKKEAASALQSAGVEELPKSFTIDDVPVPTDILQRTYAHRAAEVRIDAKIQSAAGRKGRVDPIVPGVSISHVRMGSGTVGCVAYDAKTGAPYVLSNWHVLCGPDGAHGDGVAQPGANDDSNTEKNRVGRLERFHLGEAGDCAIASIEHRGLSPAVEGLKVTVNRIGDPGLGDLVVKSGRTTDVTYGIVRRVHVNTVIDYPGVGKKIIGGFEIQPAPKPSASKSQISKPGDSGSAWLYAKNGKPTDMMVGLHFAGEVGDQPDHAIACYASSVFEKLSILPSRPASAQTQFATGSGIGYKEDFFGLQAPAPRPANGEVCKDLLKIKGRDSIDYTHFSLAMSRSRRFAQWVAWNIDGGSLKPLNRRGLKFKTDDRLPEEAQVGDELYSNNDLDRGHIARRADVVWGSQSEAAQANKDSFFFTNITPQHAKFNQSSAGGIWGKLENAIFEEVDVEDLKISVMGGPIFTDSDQEYRGIFLPKQFWKIIYFRESGKPGVYSKGFILTQADLLSSLEALELPEFSVYEAPVSRIGKMTGLKLYSAKVFSLGGAGVESGSGFAGGIRKINSIQEIIG